MSDRFHIRVANDDLTFSAAHFLFWEDGTCERLHGHTYRVTAEVGGSLEASGCVVDFVAVRNALRTIVADLDHRLLLPAEHTAVRALPGKGQIEVVVGDRRWLFPESDCRLLPVANTTTEWLAQHVGHRLRAMLASSIGITPERVRIELTEGSGYGAVCELA